MRRGLVATTAALALAFTVGCGGSDGGGSQPVKDTGLDSQPSKPQKQTTFKPRHFSGNGALNIGNLRVPGDAVLRWRFTPSTANAGFIQILSEGGEITVMSEAPTGKSAVSAGVYKNVMVTTGGDWSITITPR